MTVRLSVVLALFLTPALLSPVLPAAAQGEPALDFVSQTLVVGDAPAEIVFDVIDAPEDARLQFRIFDTPLTTRDDVRASHTNPKTGGSRLAIFECTLEGDCRGQATLERDNDRVTLTLLDEEIGESLRLVPGTLSFLVTLLDDDDTELDEIATSLIIPPTESDDLPPEQIGIAFLSSIDMPVSHHADGSVVVDDAALESQLSSLVRADGLALTVGVHPETLTALETTNPGLLRDLVEALDGHDLLRSPWVSLDEEAWRTVGREDAVVAQYALGNDTFESLINTSPTGIAVLDNDATPATLSLLRAAGVSAVITSDGQLNSTTRSFSPNQPFQLLDESAVAMPALRTDHALTNTLATDDVELAAVQAVAELLTDASTDTMDRAVLLDLARIESSTLAAFLDLVDNHPSLTTTTITDLFSRELARAGDGVFRGELLSNQAPDIRGRVADIAASSSSIDTLAAMLEPDVETTAPLRTQLLAAASDQLTADTAAAYSEAVFQTVIDSTSGIEILEVDRITLTDRRTALPLTIVNNQPVPLNVELVLSSEKIRFPEGERQELRLRPGDNSIEIEVETLASGDARVSATVVSPGGLLELGTGTVDIRSTAISGLGLIISIVALIVLGAWWIRTILRIRRNRAAATVSAAPEEHSAPTEGES